MSFLRELLTYIRARRKYVLLPLLLIMVLLGALLVLSKGAVIAPFIYTLF